MAAPEGSPQGRSLDLPGRRATGGRGPARGAGRSENDSPGVNAGQSDEERPAGYVVSRPYAPSGFLGGILSRRRMSGSQEILPLDWGIVRKVELDSMALLRRIIIMT